MPLTIKSQHLFITFLIVILVLVIYAHTLHYPFILDDELLVKKNYLIRDWSFLPQIFKTDLTLSVKKKANFYRPMQTISYLLDYHFWRFNVMGFHLTSLILFIINCLLVYWLIFIISQDLNLSAFSALLFCQSSNLL